MSYYSDYEEEATENDGNSESKWEPIADINIISAVMKLLMEITKPNGDTGPVLNLNFKKQGDGQTMSLRMDVSTPTLTMSWVNTDSPDLKNSSFAFSQKDNGPAIEKLLSLWTDWEEQEKHSSQGGVH